MTNIPVPDIPGPRRPQCWRQDPARLIRCDRARGHAGRHTWEWAALELERAQLRVVLVALVGMDTIEELDAMEAFLRVVPGAVQDKATMIDAIHALKAVRP